MWKKLFFVFLFIILFSGLTQTVSAETCVCTAQITGGQEGQAEACNVTKTQNLDVGNNFSERGEELLRNGVNLDLDTLLNGGLQECPGNGLGASFNQNQNINITRDNCAQLNREGSSALPLSFYRFTFTCQIQQAGQNQNNQNPVAPSNKSNGTVRLVNPIGGTEENPQGTFDMRIILGRAVQVVMGLLGSITLGVLFYGGFLWLTSAGNSDKVSKGSKTMLYAVIGLFIIFGSYGILSTIIQGVRGGAIDNTPFGPENDPNALPQSCSSLTVSNCASLDKCTPFRFQFPNDQAIEECIEKTEVGNRCSEMHNDCVNRFGGAQIQDCENEFAECINR